MTIVVDEVIQKFALPRHINVLVTKGDRAQVHSHYTEVVKFLNVRVLTAPWVTSHTVRLNTHSGESCWIMNK